MSFNFEDKPKNTGDILFQNHNRGKNDECYTPRYVVEAIKPFLEPYKDKIIWCPFDTDKSEFVKCLKEWGYNVTYSHIDNGQDFFNYEPDNWDVILSNPPFSGKKLTFERCMSFNKPFALLMTTVWLNDNTPIKVFGDELQLLFLKDRPHFINPEGKDMGRPSFNSAFYCRNFLPKPICVEKGLK